MKSCQPLRSAVAFLALAAHNAEEALYARDWALAHGHLLERYASDSIVKFWAGSSFRFALLGLTLALLALSVLAARAPQRSAAIYLLLGILAVFAANALFPHIAAAAALRAYVPGLATAAALVLPAAIWVYVSTIRDGYATRQGAFRAAVAGMALYAAIAIIAIRF